MASSAAQRAGRIRREIAARGADPLSRELANLYADQRAYVEATNLKKVVQGGNRSGKTWTSLIDFLLEAVGEHPTLHYPWLPSWRTWTGWWGTVSFNSFALQTWDHWKRLLLWPGESVHWLPTRRIISIGWEKKNPETPDYIKLRRRDGHEAEIFIKSYEQGRKAFQTAAPNRIHQDEESPEDIYSEIRMRTLDRECIHSFSATPIEGMRSLAVLEEQARNGTSDVFHMRLDTRNNPSLSSRAVAELSKELGGNDENLRLRFMGYPRSRAGLVYKDHVFTAGHVIEPFRIPPEWTRYRACDHGWHHFVCLWFAVSPSEDDVILYDEYHGEEKEIGTNCKAVIGKTGADVIENTVMDRATLGAAGMINELGNALKMIDLYRNEGLECFESPQHLVWAGIGKVWRLLGERGGVNGLVPKFRVFKTCSYFLEERGLYQGKDVSDDTKLTNASADTIVKKNDHAMDAWRYRVMAGMPYREPRAAGLPASGTLARVMVERRKQGKKRCEL